MSQKTVREFAAELVSAYSTDRYTHGWGACIRMLRGRGYDDRQVEAIIRSKWTRWAADASRGERRNGYGFATSSDLARFIDGLGRPGHSVLHQVNELVRESFGETQS